MQLMKSAEVMSHKSCSMDLYLRHGSTASQLLSSSKSSANSATSNALDIYQYAKCFEITTRRCVRKKHWRTYEMTLKYKYKAPTMLTSVSNGNLFETTNDYLVDMPSTAEPMRNEGIVSRSRRTLYFDKLP
uniref:SJCHGC09211 protein n=1 Tax=Schistosoma japonicum TaxID=6182 RepID=Q5DD97_SCHJA|nr:SJCHGC09211 protein [Schistosoma japonicum]